MAQNIRSYRIIAFFPQLFVDPVEKHMVNSKRRVRLNKQVHIDLEIFYAFQSSDFMTVIYSINYMSSKEIRFKFFI